MSDLLKRISDYFANEYNGDDKTAPKMKLSVDELRYIASMNVDRCRTETELREQKNKRCSCTNADRIRSMSDEELAEFLPIVSNCMCQVTDKCMENIFERGECEKTKECALKWLQSEVEE